MFIRVRWYIIPGVIFVILLNSCVNPISIQPTPTDDSQTIHTHPTQPVTAAKHCGDTICDGPETVQNCPEDCSDSPVQAETNLPNETGQPVSTEKPVLYVGIMVHLEGWGDDINEIKFERHVQLIREYASLFETYGAKLTLESKEVTDGIHTWGDNVLLEMEQRGHGIGVHADVGGNRNYDCSKFSTELAELKLNLESLGVTVRHVSGITSHCDWVTASIDAGYLFTTGGVAYSVSSLPIELRPEEFRFCKAPSECHQPYPTELSQRLHPWRVNSGEDWIYSDPDGRLVLLPSTGGLVYMAEETDFPYDPANEGSFTQEDIDAFTEQVEEALTMLDPAQINTYYVSWSLGQPLDTVILEEWLKQIEPYIQSGQMEWKTLPEMYDLFIEWENK